MLLTISRTAEFSPVALRIDAPIYESNPYKVKDLALTNRCISAITSATDKLP